MPQSEAEATGTLPAAWEDAIYMQDLLCVPSCSNFGPGYMSNAIRTVLPVECIGSGGHTTNATASNATSCQFNTTENAAAYEGDICTAVCDAGLHLPLDASIGISRSAYPIECTSSPCPVGYVVDTIQRRCAFACGESSSMVFAASSAMTALQQSAHQSQFVNASSLNSLEDGYCLPSCPMQLGPSQNDSQVCVPKCPLAGTRLDSATGNCTSVHCPMG